MVRLMLDREGAKQGARSAAWVIDKEKLKNVRGCTSNDTDSRHEHIPFADLVTDLPGFEKIAIISRSILHSVKLFL